MLTAALCMIGIQAAPTEQHLLDARFHKGSEARIGQPLTWSPIGRWAYYTMHEQSNGEGQRTRVHPHILAGPLAPRSAVLCKCLEQHLFRALEVLVVAVMRGVAGVRPQLHESQLPVRRVIREQPGRAVASHHRQRPLEHGDLNITPRLPVTVFVGVAPDHHTELVRRVREQPRGLLVS